MQSPAAVVSIQFIRYTHTYYVFFYHIFFYVYVAITVAEETLHFVVTMVH